MLKKIISIFFILCLVFSLTVPCFAIRDSLTFYKVNKDETTSGYILFKWGFPNFSSNGYFENGYFYVNGGSSGLGPMVTIQHDHIYYYFFDVESLVDRTFNLYIYARTSNDFPTLTSATTFTPYSRHVLSGYTTRDISALGLQSYYSNISLLVHYPLIVDLTESGYNLDNYLDFEQDFLNSGGDFSQFYNFGSNYIFKDELSSNFLDFYSNLAYTFDFVPLLFSEYTQVSILITVVLSLLVVIFLVVFMIKRFTGGKT